MLSIIWVGFIGISYWGAHEYLLKSFLQLEDEQINKNVKRVLEALDQISYALGTYTTDWAHWNDAYDYIEGKNPMFVPNNLNMPAFINSNVNLMMYFDKNSRLKVGLAVDLNKKMQVPYPIGLEKYIYAGSPLVTRTDLNHDIRGLIYIPSGIMLVAAAATSYTDKTMPSNGTLLTARYLSQTLINKISNATELDLAIFFLPQLSIQGPLKNIYDAIIKGADENYIEKVNQKISYGYTLLKDINQRPIGMLRVSVPRAIYRTGDQAITYYLGVFILSGVLLAMLIWYLMRVLILKRLEYLHHEIRNIGGQHIYTKRISMKRNDELSSVAEQFNVMMDTIQLSHEKLEDQIQELSVSEKNLENTNKKLKEEIKERQEAEAKVDVLHNKLILAARRAGMADISSGVLHNVGNILNSVTTSVQMVGERVKHSEAVCLVNASKLLEDHSADLANFMVHDPKGKNISRYLSALSHTWIDENKSILEEIVSLDKNIANIKSVISKQQSLSGMIGMNENVYLANVIEDALILNKATFEQAGIEVSCDYQFSGNALIDRVKLLHVIVNLIKNSVDSLLSSEAISKKIIVRLTKIEETYFSIQIIDNGLGILPEHLSKIFSYGFTTKKTGHGFGLHASALSAQEMGGNLSMESEGPNKGAIFTLVLPLNPLKDTFETKPLEEFRQ